MWDTDRQKDRWYKIGTHKKANFWNTFNSILKKDRDETKDLADYYNVTVNMLVKREPTPHQAPEQWHNEDGKTLK